MKRGWAWLAAAWIVALASTLAALFIGEVMGKTPCMLCWYQRIAMFPLALILGMAAYADDRSGAAYARPFAAAGAAIAGYHAALMAGWVPTWWVPCGAGPSCSQQDQVAFGGLQLPWLSLVAFVAIFALLTAYLQRTR
jgi:disulfide bond formation protein DsbB